MPLPDFPNLDDSDDAAKRAQFVRSVLEALKRLVEGQEYRGLFADDLHRDMDAAWNDAVAGFGEFPRASHGTILGGTIPRRGSESRLRTQAPVGFD